MELWSCGFGTGAVVLWLPIVIVETWLWSCGNGAVAVVPELRLWNCGAVELWLWSGSVAAEPYQWSCYRRDEVVELWSCLARFGSVWLGLARFGSVWFGLVR